jgi:hypothetical protein
MIPRSPFACAALCALSLLALSNDAAASTTYPEELRKYLQLDAIVGPAPGCRVCHQDDMGGLKTATKPVGRALISAGTAGGNVPSFLAALETLDAEHVDSDRDGSPDLDELRAGTDPNVAMDSEGTIIRMEEVPLPQTGCALALSSGPAPTAPWWLALAFFARRMAGGAGRAQAASRAR